jgi:hypothetical protein
MTLRSWAGVLPLCVLLCAAACDEEELGEGDGAGAEDAGSQTSDDGGGEVDDGATPEDAAVPQDDAAANSDPEAGSDASVSDASAQRDAQAEASTSDASAGAVDEQGFPILPSGMNNILFLTISNSSSKVLADGQYQAPFSPNASSGSTLTYLDNSYIFTMQPSLQVQMNLKRTMQDGSFECETGTTVLLRYGKPPSGSNQLLTKSCTVKYTYDAGKNQYTGTIDAKLGDGLTEASDEKVADARARFTVIGSNK